MQRAGALLQPVFFCLFLAKDVSAQEQEVNAEPSGRGLFVSKNVQELFALVMVVHNVGPIGHHDACSLEHDGAAQAMGFVDVGQFGIQTRQNDPFSLSCIE